MVRLDHMTLPVGDWRATRDWWRDNLGFEVEFEIADASTVAMKDDADLTVFFSKGKPLSGDFALTVRVDDVKAKHKELAAKGIPFVHPPQELFWGFGAELRDPNG
ncbi:MAG TPA: VOC family protein, partial [Alphaproteobacteria bacterium]|nr:VOC family protein [Alphaproteobacteria bacterium]